MLTKNQIGILRNKLDTEKNIYSWYGRSPAILGRYGSLVKIIIVCIPMAIMVIPVTIFFILNGLYLWSVGFVFLASLIFCLMYFCQFADNFHEYKLTKIGIITISQQIIPDGVYTFFRGFAWVGIVICLVAFIVIGPLAFVGADAFGLMSFGMTSFSPSKYVSKKVFAERMIMFYVKETDSLQLKAHPVQLEASISLYFETEASRKIVEEKIKQILPTMVCFSVERDKEMRTHPVYVAAIEARRAINPELYS